MSSSEVLIADVRPAPGAHPSTREWLRRCHRRLQALLPARGKPALLTEDLTGPDGRPVDVLRHYGLSKTFLRTLIGNRDGLVHTARQVSTSFAIDQPAPPWPGFEDAWVPVTDTLRLAGRLGWAQDEAGVRDADCIVILPGLFGDNGILRTRDLAEALRDWGFHALALEMRGHGQTEARYPDVAYAFGGIETGDLMAVAEWLQRQPHVRRTGLIGYCWGANHAMLAAWYDNHPTPDPSINPRLAPCLRPVSPERHYEAGVMAFSPVLRFEELVDWLDTPRSSFFDPILAGLQDTVRDHIIRKGYPEVSGSLRRLIQYEYDRSEVGFLGAVQDGYQFLRFLPYRDKPAGDKLNRVRVPTLIVQGANDPLNSGQDIAELMAGVNNQQVAALVLPGGGHIGFAAYAKAYYYSLILSFFDPVHGAAGSGDGALADRMGK